MITITQVRAREILDCRGLPTVQAEVEVNGHAKGRADVPSGRSTGTHEAQELRDGGNRFGGFGVTAAVKNVNTEIADALEGRDFASLRHLDSSLIQLDGTEDKSRLGANALLGVSLAGAHAAACMHGLPLYLFLNCNAHLLPIPLINLINGGKHASNDLDFQEFIVVPAGAQSIREALQIATETNLCLAEILLKRFGKVALNTGDEGGFAPPLHIPEEALELLHRAVERAGYERLCSYGLDCAATHWFDRESRTYRLAGKELDSRELIELYLRLIQDYGLVTIEDPLSEDDFEGFAELTRQSGVQIIGDDLFATNPRRIARGVETGAGNALLWKVNQIGTLTEALDAADLAFRAGFRVVVSERSGETEDATLAELAVALNAGQIKTGAPVRGERTSKYNALFRIAEELGSASEYPTWDLAPKPSAA